MNTFRRSLIVAGACTVATVALPVRAHGDGHGPGKKGAVPKEQKPWGIAGEPRAAKRTLRIVMTDDMRFAPNRIEVALGETVRLSIRNNGKMMHELVIGTREELDRHAELMVKFPNMEHDEPYMAHVAPGKSGEIVWQFNRAGEFGFACLIAGHFQAGMTGTIRVVAK